jgi:flagellar assembly protein FliH
LPTAAPQSAPLAHVETFLYAASAAPDTLHAWEGWGAPEKVAAPEPHPSASPTATSVSEAALRAEFDKRLAEETRKAFESGREKGRGEGRQTEHEAQAVTLAAAEERRVRQAAEWIENFSRERDRYMQAVEHEVVDLALMVAARILRREAQMDPLMLTGAVRVALGQLSSSTQVRLRVPPTELDMWTEAMAHLPNLAVKPTVLAGEGMRLGDCVMETELGSVDLGVRAQLGEIERGFFDRVGGRRGAGKAHVEDTSASREEQ